MQHISTGPGFWEVAIAIPFHYFSLNKQKCTLKYYMKMLLGPVDYSLFIILIDFYRLF